MKFETIPFFNATGCILSFPRENTKEKRNIRHLKRKKVSNKCETGKR